MAILPVPGSCVNCDGGGGGGGTPVTLTSQARMITPGSPWTPGGDVTGTLTGLALNVITGTATITDEDSTVTAGVPAGTSFDWNAEDANTLTGPVSVASVGGTILATWTER